MQQKIIRDYHYIIFFKLESFFRSGLLHYVFLYADIHLLMLLMYSWLVNHWTVHLFLWVEIFDKRVMGWCQVSANPFYCVQILVSVELCFGDAHIYITP